jgi:hypothetical protein
MIALASDARTSFGNEDQSDVRAGSAEIGVRGPRSGNVISPRAGRRGSELGDRGCRSFYHGCGEGATNGFFDEELGSGKAEPYHFADRERMTGAGIDPSCSDVGAVPAAGILQIPLTVFYKDAGMAPGDGLRRLAVQEDPASWVATDKGLGAIDSVGFIGALIEEREVRHYGDGGEDSGVSPGTNTFLNLAKVNRSHIGCESGPTFVCFFQDMFVIGRWCSRLSCVWPRCRPLT